MIKLLKTEVQLDKEIDLKVLYKHLKYNPQKIKGSSYVLFNKGSVLEIWTLKKFINKDESEKEKENSHLGN